MGEVHGQAAGRDEGIELGCQAIERAWMERAIRDRVEVNGTEAGGLTVVEVLRELACIPTVEHATHARLEACPRGDVVELFLIEQRFVIVARG